MNIGILLTKSVTPWSAADVFSNAGCRIVITHASADIELSCTYRGEFSNHEHQSHHTSTIHLSYPHRLIWLLPTEIRGPTVDAGTVEAA